jgi:hypothetical protein
MLAALRQTVSTRTRLAPPMALAADAARAARAARAAEDAEEAADEALFRAFMALVARLDLAVGAYADPHSVHAAPQLAALRAAAAAWIDDGSADAFDAALGAFFARAEGDDVAPPLALGVLVAAAARLGPALYLPANATAEQRALLAHHAQAHFAEVRRALFMRRRDALAGRRARLHELLAYCATPERAAGRPLR